MTEFIEIESERLRLRQVRESDTKAYSRFYADPENARYVGGQKNADEAWRSMAMIIGHWHLKGHGYWAVDEKSSGDFVGCVGLWQSPEWPELELGYWIVPEKQGLGYATEAGRQCIDYARDKLHAESLVSYIDPDNLASIRVAESLGAKYEKTIDLATHGPHRVYRHF